MRQNNSLRLDDTSEGINKKYELEQQRLQSEREEDEKSKENQEQTQKDARMEKKKREVFTNFSGKRPYITQIIAYSNRRCVCRCYC